MQLLRDHAHVRLGRSERQVRGVQPHHPSQLQHHQRAPPAQPFRCGSNTPEHTQRVEGV